MRSITSQSHYLYDDRSIHALALDTQDYISQLRYYTKDILFISINIDVVNYKESNSDVTLDYAISYVQQKRQCRNLVFLSEKTIAKWASLTGILRDKLCL